LIYQTILWPRFSKSVVHNFYRKKNNTLDGFNNSIKKIVVKTIFKKFLVTLEALKQQGVISKTRNRAQ